MVDPVFELLIETSNGVAKRSIMPASLLAPDRPRGRAAEEATRSAAAYWGLPDFVFRPTVQVRGARNRELGDVIVVAGDRGAVVQVKARDNSAAPSRERERAWLNKTVAAGAKQGRGTIRSLRYSRRVTLANERRRRVVISTASVNWVPVVVVDHPGIDDYVPTADAVVLIRRDWEFLFEQLKSTDAVLGYLHRVYATGDPPPLGDEAIRYYQLAAADLKALPSQVDPRLADLGAEPLSGPLLPQKPVSHGEIVRVILEDVATAPMTESLDQADVLATLAAIDSAPVSFRTELGETIVHWLHDRAIAEDDETKWWLRRLTDSHRMLIFGTATRHNALVQEAFGGYVSLRHQQHIELIPEQRETVTVGVLLTPRFDGWRPWDTTVAATKGDQHLDPEHREALERVWGSYASRQ